jgi:D-amino-acid dehydrogenase
VPDALRIILTPVVVFHGAAGYARPGNESRAEACAHAIVSRQVAVIGAGIVGTMCAIHLLRSGHDVTIVEPESPGGEHASSYGNSGWLSTHSVIPPAEPGVWKKVPGYLADPLGPVSVRWSYLPQALPWLVRYLASAATWGRVAVTAQALRPLLADSPRLHAEVADAAGVGSLIAQTGVLHAYRLRADFERDAMPWQLRRNVGVRWRELDADELHRREPSLHERYRFALHVEEAGHCRDPGAYTKALFAHALAQGARHVKARAIGWRIESQRLRAVRTDAGDIDAEAAVIAAGARSRALAAAAGDRVPLKTERGYHATIASPEAAPQTPIMAMDCKVIATGMRGGLRIGGQVEIAAHDAAPNWRRAAVVRDLGLGMFPALPRDLPADRLRFWLGRRPSTPDGLPCIGYASATRDIVHAFGHGHVGLSASARTGRVVAQLLSDATPEIPVAPFDARRFR